MSSGDRPMSGMSRRRRKTAVRWARYFNHYAHIPYSVVGGWGALRALNTALRDEAFRHVRRQQKHHYGRGYSNDQ